MSSILTIIRQRRHRQDQVRSSAQQRSQRAVFGFGFTLSALLVAAQSSITAHFSENTGSIYLNVFSCKEFDPDDAAMFCKKYFGANGMKKRFIIRK